MKNAYTLEYYIIFILTLNGTTNIDYQNTQYCCLTLLAISSTHFLSLGTFHLIDFYFLLDLLSTFPLVLHSFYHRYSILFNVTRIRDTS